MVGSMKEKSVMTPMLLEVMDATTVRLKMDGNVNKMEEEYLFVAQGQFHTAVMVFMNHKMVRNVMTETN